MFFSNFQWLLIFTFSWCIVSATDEYLNLQHYMPVIKGEETLNVNKRFQQIMQGGNHGDVIWPQPPKPKLEINDVKAEIDKLNSTYIYQSSWPDSSIKLGSVSAVSFDVAGNVVIFHRVDRMWTQQTFSNDNIFMERKKGPIRNNTVLALDRESGKIVYEWGKNIFYMPHGLTVDHEDNVWLTDVALHQVFKFGPQGSKDQPLMTLGTAFTPGAGDTKFCKPTSVAVLQNGDFFVADGYCNARILKYTKNGEKILTWGQNSFSGVSFEVAPKNFFAIPHALTLVPKQELICAADRENGRVQCFFWSNGTFHSQYHNQVIGDRLFSMDYTPVQGGQLIIVNGPTAEFGLKPAHYNEVHGYVLDMQSKKVLSKFGPNDLQFQNPHDVAVTADATEIYVAELDPKRVHKFLHKSIAKSMSLSTVANPTTTLAAVDNAVKAANSSLTAGSDVNTASFSHNHPGGTAILVASLMLLFTIFTFAMAWLIARRRKRGCLPFGATNRRHAWDFPAGPEGYRIVGGLLLKDRSKRNGFKKLNQNDSDEEREATTNMLSSAQFA